MSDLVSDNDIIFRIKELNEKISQTCHRIGRDADEIKLEAISKFHPLSAIEEAWKGGIRLFGENRVEEAREKLTAFKRTHAGDSTEIHLTGTLQRNKAKKAVEFFDCIESLDRISLIDELGKLTMERDKPLMVYLEYHTGEESKAGFPDLDSLFYAAEKVHGYRGLKPMGLMTMAPFTGDEKAIRASFRSCKKASEELCRRFGSDSWPGLSMGMSGDFEIAIEEGSNLLRIGTAIFGVREL